MSGPAKRVRLDGRIVKNFQFTHETVRQVDEIRRQKGITFQTFVIEAVTDKIELEQAAAEKAKAKKQMQRGSERKAPQGLGIRERLAQIEEAASGVEYEDSVHDAPAPSPVTVNVGTSSSGGAGADLVAMARMIIAVPPSAQKAALKSACDTLAMSARTSEEAGKLADALDAEIKRLNVPKTVLEKVRARMKK